MHDPEGSNQYFNKNRINTLVDGIFTIAMTLLVLNLVIPHFTGQINNSQLLNSLYGILPIFFSLVLSFLLLAMFWYFHHRIYNQIKIVNRTLIWINVVWLLFVILVPFSANLAGQYGYLTAANVIFDLNLLILTSLLFLNIYVINRSGFIHEKAELDRLKQSEKNSIYFILITLLALALAFIFPQLSNLAYFLIFLWFR
ncbi:MAG: TMEM175 family protein [Methanobacterium sp.]